MFTNKDDSHIHNFKDGVAVYMWGGRILWLVVALIMLSFAFQKSAAAQARGNNLHTVFLPLITTTGDNTEAPTQSSAELINLALQRGELDSEAALTYRVFATFGDERLPTQYRGIPSEQIDSTAIDEVQSIFPSLSFHTQELLAPFLIPPIYEGSWYDLRQQATHSTTVVAQAIFTPIPTPEPFTVICNGVIKGEFGSISSLADEKKAKFRIWFLKNDSTAHSDATQIGQDLETVADWFSTRFKSPKNDSQLQSDNAKKCNPSPGQIDIYILYDTFSTTYDNDLAVTELYPDEPCGNGAGYIILLKRTPNTFDILLHEYMHLVQRAYDIPAPCFNDDKAWWKEATATWAIDAYHANASNAQFEQKYAKQYLSTVELSIAATDSGRAYGAYLFPFYLAHREGSNDVTIIADIFQQMESAKTADLYAVIDSKIEGGFAQRWPEFAFYNLNVNVYNYYEQWDMLKEKVVILPAHQLRLELGSRTHVFEELPKNTVGMKVNSLAASYYHFDVSDNTHLLAIKNTFSDQADVHVQALLNIAGKGWQPPIDWSQKEWSLLCRDKPEERVTEFVLVVSSSDWKNPKAEHTSNGPLRFVLTDTDCTGWQGTASWKLTGISQNDESTLNYEMKGNANVTFELSEVSLISDTLTLMFQIKSGSANWSISAHGVNPSNGVRYDCDKSGFGDLAAEQGILLINEEFGSTPPKRSYSVFGTITTGGVIPCEPLQSWTVIPWIQTGDTPQQTDRAGARLVGTVSETKTGDGVTSAESSDWDFVEVK